MRTKYGAMNPTDVGNYSSSGMLIILIKIQAVSGMYFKLHFAGKFKFKCHECIDIVIKYIDAALLLLMEND